MFLIPASAFILVMGMSLLSQAHHADTPAKRTARMIAAGSAPGLAGWEKVSFNPDAARVVRGLYDLSLQQAKALTLDPDACLAQVARAVAEAPDEIDAVTQPRRDAIAKQIRDVAACAG
jgi:hypothetical protein